jgi:uncharacterized protein (DUF488 family)
MQTEEVRDQSIVYTIGHSNVQVEGFLNLLKGIEVVVDVRSTPFSQYAPQFNAHSIKDELSAAGIDYVFMEDEYLGNILGGRPRDEGCYESGKIVYERVKERSWYQEGISELVELAGKKTLAVMCSEEDPHQCHRHHLIAQTLLESGLTVLHIRGDGTLEAAEKEAVQPSLL